MKSILFAVMLVAACNEPGCLHVDPVVPDPSVSPAPIQPLDACEEESAHVGHSGLNCPEWSPSYVADCKALDVHLATEHQQIADHTCVLKASSCDSARACP